MMLVPAMMIVALAGQADPTTASRVKETAYARVARAQAIARDAAIHAAVVASNAVSEPPDVIKRRDTVWIANPRDPLRQAIVQAPCSVKVRDLVKEDVLVVEAFVMNDRGTLVCSIAETSDYWQGDEAKWQRTFVDGKEAFVEDPAFDASTGKYAIQVSVPIAEGAKRIGAVTLTLKLKGQEAAAVPKD
ncbi:MAG TPA: PDC sensor domain-containing protein [Vicinamibacteria bacterium]|nr:PDC sensor domain-containing protein [Vicinamibacteria bacterium]